MRPVTPYQRLLNDIRKFCEVSRDPYMPDLADALKERAGEKYRPSNGTEGGLFISLWCDTCTKDADQNCPIVAASFAFDVDEPEYPSEWRYGEDGQPQCTAYEEAHHG